MNNKFFFVIGPSGAGKTTLVNHAIEQLGQSYKLKRLESYTTRIMRENEGQDFIFVDDPTFLKLRKNKFFVESETYAGFKHGISKKQFENLGEFNYIKEITINGLNKIINYAEKNNFRDNIKVINIVTTEKELMDRLKYYRNMKDDEILERRKADEELDGMKQVNRVIYNINNKFVKDPKEELIKYIESELEKENKMIIHHGYKEINHKANKDKQFVHIIVDSEKKDGVSYYVTVDRNNGNVIGCSCPQSAMFPFEKCKHQKAVIEQRFLGK